MSESELKRLKIKMDNWLADDRTWEEALDGLSGIDLADAVVRKMLETILSFPEPRKPRTPKTAKPSDK